MDWKSIITISCNLLYEILRYHPANIGCLECLSKDLNYKITARDYYLQTLCEDLYNASTRSVNYHALKIYYIRRVCYIFSFQPNTKKLLLFNLFNEKSSEMTIRNSEEFDEDGAFCFLHNGNLLYVRGQSTWELSLYNRGTRKINARLAVGRASHALAW